MKTINSSALAFHNYASRHLRALLLLLTVLLTGLSAAAQSGTLRDADSPSVTAPGLDYGYYEGTGWTALPDFTTLTTVANDTVSTFNLTPRRRNDNFAFRYTGYVRVPTDGQYTFYTTSDDGSQLFIGTQLVVNNDGLHGARTRNGRIGLKAGLHAITVTFFERTGGQTLTVGYAGPGLSRRPIPASALLRPAPPVRSVISGLQPNTAQANTGAYGLIVTGANFIDGVSVVNFNGAPIFTMFVSATQLQATIPAEALTTPGTFDVTVRNTAPASGGLSAPVPFIVTPAAPLRPVISSLSPGTVAAGTGAFTLTIVGANFIDSISVVNFNGVALPTRFVSTTQLTATVPAAAVDTSGTFSVTVRNTAPASGGLSAPVTFTVTDAAPNAPTISSLSPSTAVADQAAVVVTVTGTNFISGVSVVNFNGRPLATTFVSATQLRATVPDTALTDAGTFSVTVRNTAPGSGGLSAPATFTVTDAAPAPPTITSLSPNTITAGSGNFVLTVRGTNFIEGLSIINFISGSRQVPQSLATTFVSATELRATVQAEAVARAGTFPVTVRNTSPQFLTGPVAQAIFTVTAAGPAPVLAVNSGGPAAGRFGADQFFGGLEGAPAGTPSSTTASIDISRIDNPAPEAVYQSQREGTRTNYFVYSVTSGLVEGQTYRLRLHFAEIDYTSPGQRQFSVVLNGTTTLLSDFDIYAEAGGTNVALVREFTFTARPATSSTRLLFLRFNPGPAADMQLYPNPARDAATINLQTASSQPANVEVHDALGRRVAGFTHATHAGYNQLRLPLQGLPAGMYSVTVRQGSTHSVQRLAVEK